MLFQISLFTTSGLRNLFMFQSWDSNLFRDMLKLSLKLGFPSGLMMGSMLFHSAGYPVLGEGNTVARRTFLAPSLLRWQDFFLCTWAKPNLLLKIPVYPFIYVSNKSFLNARVPSAVGDMLFENLEKALSVFVKLIPNFPKIHYPLGMGWEKVSGFLNPVPDLQEAVC